MVFFLAPIAVAGYRLYQQKMKGNHEEGQLQQQSSEDKDDVVPVLAKQQHETIGNEQQLVKLSEVSTESSDCGNELLPNSTQANNSTRSQQQPHGVTGNIPKVIHQAMASWADKFERFCNDWENEISEATTDSRKATL